MSRWTEGAARGLDLMTQEIDPGERSGEHRHIFEELLLVVKGRGYDLHEGMKHRWEDGDLICVPPMIIHQHMNDGKDTAHLVSVWPRQPGHELLGGYRTDQQCFGLATMKKAWFKVQGSTFNVRTGAGTLNAMRRIIASKMSFIFVLVYLLSMANAAGSQLIPIKIAYATTSGIRLPLWIAEEARLYEKYGLDAKLINIPSGNTAISALVSGEVDIVSGSGSASIVAAGRGLPIVIVGSFGSTTYKLVANPGVSDLRGKIVGTSRIGSTTDFALRRALVKLGLAPDKDVKILATGIGEADKRIMLMLQGRMDGTLGSPESILAAETQTKVKLEILADLEEMKIYNTVGDLSTRIDLLKIRRDLLRAFFMASSEAIALGKKNKALAQKVITKNMKVTDRKRLDTVYDASLGRMPSKPYPREEAVQLELESVAFTDPLFRNKKPSEFMDNSIITELERKGFFTQLQ